MSAETENNNQTKIHTIVMDALSLLWGERQKSAKILLLPFCIFVTIDYSSASSFPMMFLAASLNVAAISLLAMSANRLVKDENTAFIPLIKSRRTYIYFSYLMIIALAFFAVEAFTTLMGGGILSNAELDENLFINFAPYLFLILLSSYLSTRLALIAPILSSDEEYGFLTSLKKAWVLGRGNFWKMAIIIILCFLLYLLINGAIRPEGEIDMSVLGPAKIPNITFANLAYAFCELWTFTAIALFYQRVVMDQNPST